MKKSYTIGEIVRLGLLKNHKGEAYKHKASVLKIVLQLPHVKVNTPWGIGYAVSTNEIEKHNKKQEAFSNKK